jgi:hypothetical protein
MGERTCGAQGLLGSICRPRALQPSELQRAPAASEAPRSLEASPGGCVVGGIIQHEREYSLGYRTPRKCLGSLGQR